MTRAFQVWMALCVLLVGGCTGQKGGGGQPSGEAGGNGTAGATTTTEQQPQSPARLAVVSIEMDPQQPRATRQNNLKIIISNQGGTPSTEYRATVFYQEAGNPNTFFPVYNNSFGSLQPGGTEVIDLHRKLVTNNPGSFVLHVNLAPQGGDPVTREFPFTGVDKGAPPQPPADGWAMLVVETVPSGATVEVGLQPQGNVTAPGSGRIAGTTPCTIKLQASDVNPLGGVSVYISKNGYMGVMAGISDGAEKLEDHGTYSLFNSPQALHQVQ
jgi:hypothetical protein